MAGHSHSANVAIRKGAVDRKRAKLFGKISRLIIVAARQGGGDPTTNLALRYAILKGKKNSMPKENIERAIKRGCGETGGADFEEVAYEGYGPNGVAMLCDILTDNRNRTAGEVRKTFEVYGGNLGATGCVSWMFERKGLLTVPTSSIDEETLFELALESGADDVKVEDEVFEVTCSPEVFSDVNDAFENASIPTDVADVVKLATQTVELDFEGAKQVLALVDALEDNDDIQNVTANFVIPDEVRAELEAEDS